MKFLDLTGKYKVGILLLLFALYLQAGFCQTAGGSAPCKERSNITCPLARTTPESRFASQLMFFMGNFIIVVICAGISAFALSLLPRRARSCPVSKLAGAVKVHLLYGDRKIVVRPGSSEFNVIIANLSDERQQPDFQTASVTLYIYVRGNRYIVQISMAGWNFLHEERNSRRLINAMDAAKALDSLIKRSAIP